MKKVVPVDPIEAHMARVNAPKNVARVTAVYRRRWQYLEEERIDSEKRGAEWAPVEKLIKKCFRAEFPAKAWRGLGLEFNGRAYAVDWSTRRTKAYISYEATWNGLTINRHFIPTCMADVAAEAWRLAGCLLAWGGEAQP